MISYTDQFDIVSSYIDDLMSSYHHHKKDLWYGYRWTFANRQRFDLIDHIQTNTLIVRLGRGAWLVRQYPILIGLFDEIGIVIAKFHFQDIQTLTHKNLPWLLQILSQMPLGTKALE